MVSDSNTEEHRVSGDGLVARVKELVIAGWTGRDPEAVFASQR